MLNVIRFLEKMGSEAQWNGSATTQMDLALAETDIEEPIRSAILNRDIAQLQALLQQKDPVCMIIPGEEEEEEEEGEDMPDEDARLSSSLLLISQP